ncbi:protoporphyrinogen oxidase [Actinophytocola oryzae]|uniref:Coproporphyrinogen III oxidase n=1 Tax=Actinophytocola oryzae TaxID=502181 RepID=A0A4R7W0F8_9PSEU|nr:protoporphyrinogen oxidase [Actinophytocola oryzae]TDV55438.1 oxygen-dependent protoporphyrinogen oxidase [Actinophytocola oryzae]
MTHVVVVGGGVSGLTTAYRLRGLLGPSVRLTVLEQSDRLGGKLRTLDLDGVPTDVGAEAFVVRDPAALDLVAELGLGDRLVHPERAAATIHAGGATVSLPRRTFLGVPAGPDAVRDVLSPGGVEKVAGESSLPPLRLASDEDASVGELLTERMGREVVDHLVEPLLAGVYAGRADLLGLRATMPALVKALDETGSLTAAASRLLPASSDGPPKPVFGALRGGMRVLIDELARQSGAQTRLNTTVRKLTRTTDGWRIEVGSVPGPEFLEADAVVLAVPPPSARRLLDEIVPDASAAYGSVALGSMAVVSMVLPPEVSLPESSGVLLAVGEHHRDGTPFTAKAFTYTSRKWGGDRVRLRASVGRVGEEHTLRRDEDALLADVLADLAELSGVDAKPVAWTVTKWGGGLPQYGVGHAALVAEIERAVAAVPGLAVAGATFRGVGVPACVRTATAAAERVVAQLRVEE